MKRKADSVQQDKCVVILEDMLKRDKKKYHPLPDELEVSENSKNQWFSFIHAHYHPIGVIDRSTNERVKQSHKIKFELFMKNDDLFTPYSASDSTKEGVFWIQIWKPHNKGIMICKFSCVDDESIEPLIHEIRVVDKNSKSSSKSAGGKKDSKSEQKSLPKTHILLQDILTDPRELIPPQPTIQQSLQFLQSISPITDALSFNQKNKYDAPLPFLNPQQQTATAANNSSKEKAEMTLPMIKGPLLNMKIPSSLLISLYNDKSVVSPLLCTYLEASMNNIGGSWTKKQKKEADRGFERIMSPSIPELLQAIISHYKSLQNLPTINDLISFLCLLFDQILFTHILYENEMKIYEKWLVGEKNEETEVVKNEEEVEEENEVKSESRKSRSSSRTRDEKSNNSNNRRSSRLQAEDSEEEEIIEEDDDDEKDNSESERDEEEHEDKQQPNKVIPTEYYEEFGPYFFLRFLVVLILNIFPADSSANTLSTGRVKGPLNDLEKLMEFSFRFLDEHSSTYFC
jgi:hypothetical protein